MDDFDFSTEEYLYDLVLDAPTVEVILSNLRDDRTFKAWLTV